MTTTHSEALDRFERALRSVARRLYAPTRRSTQPGMLTGDSSCPDKAAYVLMSELARGGHQRVSDLAGTLGVDVSTVSRQLHELDEAGLVLRSPDPDDGRAVRLELSEAGSALLESARALRHELLGQAMAVLDAVEQAQLLSAFERLAGALEKEEALEPEQVREAEPAPETGQGRGEGSDGSLGTMVEKGRR